MVNLIATGLFNAVAFSASAYLFWRLSYRNYQKELIHQNKAVEDLGEAKEKWYDSEIAKKDRIRQLRMELNDANHNIEKPNQVLDLLKLVQSIEYNAMRFTR